MGIRISRDKIVILSYFSGIILAGASILMLPGAWTGPNPLRFIDALFTSTSAVCVTGLITVDTALYSRFGQAIIMALIQFGGLGIITFATLYVALPRSRISLVNQAIIKDYFIGEVEYDPKRIIRQILVTTAVVEGLGAFLLLARFRGMKDALFVSAFHAVSAFCNAGFSTFSTSLEAYVGDPLVSLTICGLIICGGMGFIVFRDLGIRLRGKRKRLTTHTRIVLLVTFCLLVGGSLLFFWLERWHAMRDLPLGSKILASLFLSTTPRTAGFDTINPASLGHTSTLLTILLMFIGASPGSTGGGVKTTTFFIVLLAALKGADEEGRVSLGSRSLGISSILKAFGVVGKGLMIIIVSTAAILLLERGRVAGGGVSLVEAVYEVTSGFATVGLSLGITPGLLAGSKLVLILTMFAGRIGLFAMSLPGGARRIDRWARLPEADVMIG
jgi:trk system potassium uptake protein TrkH